MFANLNGWHLIIVLAVVLLLFGATKLPALSRSVGQSMRIFKSEAKAMKDDDARAATPAAPVAATDSASAAAPVADVAAAAAAPASPAEHRSTLNS